MEPLYTVCGEMPETASGISQWAGCNFTFLVWIVIITIAVLFILAALEITTLVWNRRRY